MTRRASKLGYGMSNFEYQMSMARQESVRFGVWTDKFYGRMNGVCPLHKVWNETKISIWM